MALNFSTGFKNAILDTGSLKATFDDGFITLFAGSVPADADADASGNTELVTYSDNGATPAVSDGLDLEASAANGAIAKESTQVWKGSASATSTATFFRYHSTHTDTHGASTTLIRIQGTVGGAGADLFLSSTTITTSVDYTLDAFSISIPNL